MNVSLGYYPYAIILFIMLVTIVAHLYMMSLVKRYSSIHVPIPGNPVSLISSLATDICPGLRVQTNRKKFSDCYDAREKVIILSEQNALYMNVSSLAISFHEVGHALQARYSSKILSFMKYLHPLTVTSLFATPTFLVAGLFIHKPLGLVGLVAYVPFCIYFLATVLLERDANRRAIALLSGFIEGETLHKAERILVSALNVYIAFALFTMLMFPLIVQIIIE